MKTKRQSDPLGGSKPSSPNKDSPSRIARSPPRKITKYTKKNDKTYKNVTLVCRCCQEEFIGNLHHRRAYRRPLQLSPITSSSLTRHLRSQIVQSTHTDLVTNSGVINSRDPTLQRHRSRNCHNYYLRDRLVHCHNDKTTIRRIQTLSSTPLPPLRPIHHVGGHTNQAERNIALASSHRKKSSPQKTYFKNPVGSNDDDVGSLSSISNALLLTQIENSISREALEAYLDVEEWFLDQSADDLDQDDDPLAGLLDQQVHQQVPSETSRPVISVPQQQDTSTRQAPSTGTPRTSKVRSTFLDLLAEHRILQQEDTLREDPQLLMEVGLLKLCHEYKLPLSAQKKFQEWARDSVRRQPSVFERPIRTRQKILEECRGQLGIRAQNDFQERVQRWLPENKETSVFIRSLLKSIFDILMDPKAMGPRSENVKLPHSSDPTVPIPDSGQPPETVRQLTDGQWYRASVAKYCDFEKKEMLIPLIFTLDKSITDLYSRLNVTPFLMTLGILDIQTRRDPSAWRVLAHLLDDEAEAQNQETKTIPAEKIQNLHNTLSMVLEELRELHESGDSIEWDLYYGGQYHRVRLKFAIAYVISDSEMHHKLCGSYGSFGSTMKCPCRMCDTPFKYLCVPEVFRKHKMLTPQRLLFWPPSYYREDKDFKQLSQHKIDNAWYGLPWGDNKCEIHLGAAPETLHVVEKGAQKRCVESLHYVIHNASTIEFEKNKWVATSDKQIENTLDKIDFLGRRYGILLGRQSERNKPRTIFGNGLFSGTKKTAKEQSGVVLDLLFAMLSDRGRRILIEERGIHPKFLQKVERMFERSLQLGEWLKKKEYPHSLVSEPQKMAKPIDAFVKQVTETCAREGNGPNVLKNHLLLHLPSLVHMFGPPNGWDSGPPEELHKHYSKHPGKLTQRRQRRFRSQLADRASEIDVICAMIGQYIGVVNPYVVVDRPTITEHDAGSRFKVGYDDSGHACIKWDLKRNRNKPGHFPQVVEFACDTIFPNIDANEIAGFTEFKLSSGDRDIIFRAHPSFNSDSGQTTNMWYDWAKFRYENDAIFPGRIFMFLRITGLKKSLQGPSGGIPIDPSDKEIQVAVVQMFDTIPTKNFRPSRIDDGPYSTLVEYGRVKPSLELIACDRIVDSIVVVPNIGYKYNNEDDLQTPKKMRESDPLGKGNGDDLVLEGESLESDGFFVLGSRDEWAMIMERLMEMEDLVEQVEGLSL